MRSAMVGIVMGWAVALFSGVLLVAAVLAFPGVRILAWSFAVALGATAIYSLVDSGRQSQELEGTDPGQYMPLPRMELRDVAINKENNNTQDTYTIFGAIRNNATLPIAKVGLSIAVVDCPVRERAPVACAVVDRAHPIADVAVAAGEEGRFAVGFKLRNVTTERGGQQFTYEVSSVQSMPPCRSHPSQYSTPFCSALALGPQFLGCASRLVELGASLL